MAATATKERRKAPYTAGDLHSIGKMDTSKIKLDQCYMFTLQLGSGVRWGSYGPGKVVRDPKGDTAEGAKGFRMQAAVHQVKTATGETLLGLIANANKWLAENSKGSKNITRMIAVYDIEETDLQPPQAPMRTITPKAIELIVANTIKSLVGSGVLVPAKA